MGLCGSKEIFGALTVRVTRIISNWTRLKVCQKFWDRQKTVTRIEMLSPRDTLYLCGKMTQFQNGKNNGRLSTWQRLRSYFLLVNHFGGGIWTLRTDDQPFYTDAHTHRKLVGRTTLNRATQWQREYQSESCWKGHPQCVQAKRVKPNNPEKSEARRAPKNIN